MDDATILPWALTAVGGIVSVLFGAVMAGQRRTITLLRDAHQDALQAQATSHAAHLEAARSESIALRERVGTLETQAREDAERERSTLVESLTTAKVIGETLETQREVASGWQRIARILERRERHRDEDSGRRER